MPASAQVGTSPDTVKVLIVEDHRLLAEGIRAALEERGMDVGGMASTGREALSLARAGEVEVVLLDLILPDADGMEVGRRILELQPGVRILVLTGLDEGEVVPEVLEAGFHGLLHKQATTSELIEAIRLVAAGKAVLPHAAARAMVVGSGPGKLRERPGRTSQLTAREQEVLALIAGGLDTAGIADALFLSKNTVRTHIGNILRKLRVHSRVEAAALAVRERIVEPRRPRGRTHSPTSGYGDRPRTKMRRSGA